MWPKIDRDICTVEEQVDRQEVGADRQRNHGHREAEQFSDHRAVDVLAAHAICRRMPDVSEGDQGNERRHGGRNVRFAIDPRLVLVQRRLLLRIDPALRRHIDRKSSVLPGFRAA